MVETDKSFTQLMDMEIPKVCLEGVIAGSVITQEWPNQGIQFTLGPHQSDTVLRGISSETRVIVTYPGQFSDSALATLLATRVFGNYIYIEGSYIPEKSGEFLGSIQASEVTVLPYGSS